MSKNIIGNTWITNKDLKNLKQDEFTIRKFNLLPNSLFKYFPNVYTRDTNYSQQAILTNEVFLANPENFNDPFDCSIVINFSDYYIAMLQFYTKLFGINKKYQENLLEIYKNFHCYQFIRLFIKLKFIFLNNKMFNKNIDFRYCSNEMEKLELECFLLKLQSYIYENYDENNNYKIENLLYKGIFGIMRSKMKEEINKLKRNFRVASFTVQRDNILMWSHYANNHKGFCIEYSIDKTNIFNNILLNLSPVIYSPKREKINEFFVNNKSIFEWYKKGLLKKSDLWSYEEEWRLILTKNDCSLKGISPFFPIKAIYCGCKMLDEEIENIKRLIVGKNIELYQAEISEEYYQINFKKIMF